MIENEALVERFKEVGERCLPGLLGIEIIQIERGKVKASLPVLDKLMAPNGYMHAGSIVTLADTACGYGCMASLPEGASGFTTVELKSNHLSTAKDGKVICNATAVHLGRTTQVWDAVISLEETGKTMALFRCTQMILMR